MQFRYGNLYAHVYAIGDLIAWGEPEEGKREILRAMIRGDGVCHACGADEVLFDIVVNRDKIVAAERSPHSRLYPVEGYVDLDANP